MVFGNTTTGISTPIPGFAIGNYQVNGYNFFIIVISVLLILAMLAVLKGTRLGLIARGTMQRSDIAAALGYSPDRIYMATFFVGSALSGLAGAVLAPLVGLVPTSGGAFIAKAFYYRHCGRPVSRCRASCQQRNIRTCRTNFLFRCFTGDGRRRRC